MAKLTLQHATEMGQGVFSDNGASSATIPFHRPVHPGLAGPAQKVNFRHKSIDSQVMAGSA